MANFPANDDNSTHRRASLLIPVLADKEQTVRWYVLIVRLSLILR